MITIKPVDEKNYEKFFSSMVKLYAEQSVEAGRWKPEEALRLAEEESVKLLPEKYKTKNTFIYNILEDTAPVGYVWAGPLGADKQEAFIYAFEIFEEYRGLGYGKKGYSLMENKLAEMGFSSIRLHVFENSRAAIALYKSSGYGTVSRTMKKNLDTV